ncbi:MAG TPA: extracellular solute-binding protein, partial [Bacilli bacterium]
ISQQKSDFLDKDGKVVLDNETNIKTLEFLQKLYKEKTLIAAPGGFHHAEEYYGFMNGGGAASIWMPFWYMGRFTDYMPDLKGKMIIRPMPSWETGGFRSAGMGGTATVVTKSSEHVKLATNFLAFAKLSKVGNIEIWKQLGFDPVRTDVWEAPELKEANKFTDYFGTNIFETLTSIKGEIFPVNVGENTPAASDAVKQKAVFQVINDGKDPAAVLKAISDELRK